jgi:hypothetical protein
MVAHEPCKRSLCSGQWEVVNYCQLVELEQVGTDLRRRRNPSPDLTIGPLSLGRDDLGTFVYDSSIVEPLESHLKRLQVTVAPCMFPD